MKSFEKLVLAYLKNITLHAVNMGLHFILQHLDRPGTYVRILFVDFTSAFNTIIPTLLQTKLNQLSVPSSICQWITSFLTDRQQLVRMGTLTSSSRTTNTGALQGCVLFPLLFSLYTNDCTSKDPSVKLLKFADDTTLIGLIQDGEESAYTAKSPVQEVKELAVWCRHNNLELNTLKTVEMIIDFRRNPPALPPLSITHSTVATVETFKFLGSVISQDLKWDLLKQFYSAVIEPVLCTSVTVWFGSAAKSDIRQLQRIVRTAERIIGAPLSTIQELYSSRSPKHQDNQAQEQFFSPRQFSL
ncbi:putative RNA-directed DNA polymerase from transposon BS [Labeo rohita]|uniref:RNA-directed DNA polymerase from transposon BS n=1 Tax=Labeo rohita TaxID=84645 RepID=A0ABQ8KZ47_LABRO|nr:putative RNA-directed DNA polymerase from transposon BS [Labeo rohita]